MTALHHVLRTQGHVVAQVVESELVVRAVGDVGGVRDPALRQVEAGEDHPDVEPEEPVDAHPLGAGRGSR